MSVFSGKCDIYDHFVMVSNGDEEKLKEEIEKTDIYYGCLWDRHRLDIHTPKDLIPYYPYLISIGSWGREGRAVIELSKESFVDREEKEFIQYAIDNILRYYRRCRRNKTEFNKEEAYEICVWNKNQNKPWVRELINNIVDANFKYDAEQAIYDGIYLPMSERYREILYKAMTEAGYSDYDAMLWCFGRRGFQMAMNQIATNKEN